MSELVAGFWDNSRHKEFVRTEVVDGELRVFAKPWGSTIERQIDRLADIYEEVWRRSTAITEIDGERYERGRLVPEASGLGDAVAFAVEHHGGQRRKDMNHTPYVAHLIAVASLALEDGATPTEAVAAVLHDTLEDCRSVTPELLASRFGVDVCRIVVGCTDASADEKPRMRWSERKARYLEHLSTAEDDVLLVSNADKLHNLMSFVADFQTGDPDDVLRRFGSPEDVVWYYRSLAEIFERRRTGERNQVRFAANLETFLAAT